MNGMSSVVLMWLFGGWIFGPGEVAGTGMTAVTPLTIFASIFATVGVAMFALLGAWAVFLGIFRLRQNGNFFGARDGNESFFYPLRMVFAMALVAPVIPVAQSGGETIKLSPAHSMVAGIAKSSTQFGDEAQGGAFRAMHRFNLFNEPQFLVKVDPASASQMIDSWVIPATHIASQGVFADPHGSLAGLTADQIAQATLEIAWNKTANPAARVAESQAGPAANTLRTFLGSIHVPPIAPNDAAARTLAPDVPVEQVRGTVDRENGTEGWLCSDDGGWLSTTVCSDEYLELKKLNSASIASGLAAHQRKIWTDLVAVGMQRAIAFSNGTTTAEQEREMRDAATTYLDDAKSWYIETAQNTIRNTLAADQMARSEPYFQEVQNWGWMLGGTFVLRAASDFSRAASYSEAATSKMLPQSNLSDLTTSDVLSKVVEQSVLASIQPSASSKRSLFDEIFSLDVLKQTTGPDAQNIHNIASWGRALVGGGIGIYTAGTLSKFLPGGLGTFFDGSMTKPIGAALIAMGAMLGYVMPMLFAIYGLMGAISWITTVASTFFGITLWAAGMAAPKGEEHSSQLSAKGWNTLIFIGLYPALAVGGLAAAIVVSAIGLSLVQMFALGMWGMFDPGTAELGRPLESLGGMLIGGLMLLIVVAFLSWNVVIVSAQLITGFPRSVLNMIAFSEPGLNPYESAPQGLASGIGHIARAQATNAVSRVIGAVSSPRTPGSSGGGSR